MEPTKEKLQAHLILLEKAEKTSAEALAAPVNPIVRDAAIQRFEYVFELVWKTIRLAAAYMGYVGHSPREAIKTAYRLEWIRDADSWFEALEARNRTSHTCNEEITREVYQVAKKFDGSVREVLSILKPLL